MKERLGELPITLNRVKAPASGNTSAMTLKTNIILDVGRVARMAQANIGERVMMAFGTGPQLGCLRIFFNRERGQKLSKYSRENTKIIQFIASENGEMKGFFQAHQKELSSLEMTGTIYRAGIHLFLDIAIPAAAYRELQFSQAVAALPEIPGMPGWREYTSPNLSARIAGQEKQVRTSRKPKEVPPPPLQQAPKAAPADFIKSALSFEKDYLVLKQTDGDLWIRKSTVNIDIFKVVNNQPIVKLSTGEEVALPTTPQEFVAAIARSQ